jgi:hypothetical protein
MKVLASNLVQDIFLELAVFNIKKFMQGGLGGNALDLHLERVRLECVSRHVFVVFPAITIKSCFRALVQQRALPCMSFPPHASYHSTTFCDI